jgi:HAD superfamily phosphatase
VDTIVVFDMDGVLAEVSESYRESIVQTVAYFTGQTVSRELIQRYKNAGGWNNDWALSQKLAAEHGVQVAYDDVVDRFNRFFLGKNGDGLINRERWIPEEGLLERLTARYGIALFTGRLQYEVEITLKRFAPHITFDPMLCADHVTSSKPAPDGLLAIQRAKPGHRLIYVGDTVDDARSARAAGVCFVGVAAADHLSRDEILDLFRRENASAIIESVNQIETALEHIT